MKEFILTVCGVVFLATAGEMILTEGVFKKYYKLALGFVIMCTLMEPLLNLEQPRTFEFTNTEAMSENEICALSNAYILKLHKENIEKHIMGICPRITMVNVEVSSDGTIFSAKLKGEGVSEADVFIIKEDIGCENVEVINAEN